MGVEIWPFDCGRQISPEKGDIRIMVLLTQEKRRMERGIKKWNRGGEKCRRRKWSLSFSGGVGGKRSYNETNVARCRIERRCVLIGSELELNYQSL